MYYASIQNIFRSTNPVQLRNRITHQMKTFIPQSCTVKHETQNKIKPYKQSECSSSEKTIFDVTYSQAMKN